LRPQRLEYLLASLKVPHSQLATPYNAPCTPFLVDFALSGSGTILGQSILQSGNPDVQTNTVTATTGGSVIYTDNNLSIAGPSTNLEPILLSPNGTLIAVIPPQANTTATQALPTTYIYNNRVLVNAVPGQGVGWIDNNHLLVNDGPG